MVMLPAGAYFLLRQRPDGQILYFQTAEHRRPGIPDEMRVLIIASGDLWAGAEVMVHQLARGLVGKAGVALRVVLLNEGRLASELLNLGIEIHIIGESKYTFLSLARLVRKLVIQFSPNIIHSHRYKENLLAWLVALGRHNIKLVATQHGMPEVASTAQSMASRFRTAFFFRLLSCCFNRTVVVSEEMKQALIGSYGFSVDNVIVIHNGICIPMNVISHSGERVVVGSAGRLFPVKDFSLLVEIAHYVISQNEMIDFVLAGDGPQRSMLEYKVREYGIQDRFTFLGHVDDMDNLYQRLDMYINTSVHEGIPMSVLEAMSYGLPVVVPKVGGFSEIVEDGVSGFLVDGRDPGQFTGRILDLLQPDRRCSMAKAARQRVVDRFSSEAMARAYYQLYQEVVGGSWPI